MRPGSPDPFVVTATQNPVEYEGTYPLPEAQLDRFLLKLTLPLPPRDEEIQVLTRHAGGFDPRDLAAAGIRPVAGERELAAARAAVRRVTIAPEVLAYVVDVARATRQSPAVRLGVSPRGHRPAGCEPSLGMAHWPQLHHPRRRQGVGSARAAPSGSTARGGRARGRPATG